MNFRLTQVFTNSIDFTKSNYFTRTSQFHSSIYFSGSGYFSKSTIFSRSKIFEKSNIFSQSSIFTHTCDHSKLEIITKPSNLPIIETEFQQSPQINTFSSIYTNEQEINIEGSRNKNSITSNIWLIIGIILGILVILIILIIILIKRKQKEEKEQSTQEMKSCNEPVNSQQVIFGNNDLSDFISVDNPMHEDIISNDPFLESNGEDD